MNSTKCSIGVSKNQQIAFFPGEFYNRGNGRRYLMDLSAFFRQYPKAALAFSGGIDSTWLLYEAIRNHADVRAYYINSQFQTEKELQEVKDIAKRLKAELVLLPIDILSVPSVAENPKDRCYYCKTALFKTLIQRAAADGYDVVIDGTNASDDTADRPGMRALKELHVLSPLKEAGLTKKDIRAAAKAAGVPEWNKPAAACLATRIPAGVPLCEEKLQIIEKSEAFLAGLGFTDFRVRMNEPFAILQIREEQMPLAMAHRAQIVEALSEHFERVCLDMEVRS